MLMTKNNGFGFLDFLVVKEEEIYGYHRLAGSFAVIKCNEKFLLCYNTWRKQWELPSGHREEHETPKDCAIRELYEETGQIVSYLEFKGLLIVKNLSNDEVKYNPIYFTTLEELQPFQKNSETSEIKLWDLKERVGYIDEVDIKILDYIKQISHWSLLFILGNTYGSQLILRRRIMMKIIKLLIFGILGVLLIFMVTEVVSLYSTSKSENQLPIEMVAFSSLTDEESALIPVSPKDSIVKQVPVNDDIKASIDINYTKDQVYSVIFNNTKTDTTGDLIVFVGLDKNTVIGKGFTSK